ncbi:glutamate receptor ionotropic, kainate 2-like isoform X2 [Portunus trituberculatus]|uniref:glutamate receptor ionotropic, kainate 2-like isoform X2 n=1 Tax=Portunus trituberculatus TaxID=210409 RepID=UPI001E1CF049|nr:glutamate receptor ionotropic, kainate 2-like isoform X2 [Portunus trituberculatus]
MEEPVKAASLSGWSLKGRKKMGHSYIFPRGSSLSALPRPIYLLLVLLALSRRAAGSDVIRIGGLFDPEDERQEVAFRYAVDAINSDRTLLAHARLSAQIEVIPPNDSFRGSRKVCSLLKSGVAAIFGPQSGQTSAHVQSICDALEVPHIENRWDFRLTRDAYSVNLYPHPSTLSKAYMDVLMTLRWRKFYVIYENNDGLVRVQELLKNETWHITLRQLPVTDDYRPMLKDAKKAGVTYVVLDLERDKIFTVLKQAQQIGMMTSYHNYFITSLDLHTVDLEDFRHGGTNITCLRLVDPDNPLVQRVIQDWVFGELRYGRTVDAPTTSLEKSNLTFLKTEVALMYDAVRLFAKALDDLDRSRHIDVTPLDCDGDNAWVHGNSLVNYMKWVQVNGLTGLIKFDTEGFRRDVTLDIVELTKDGLTRVGKWDPANGANYTRTYSEVQQGIVESLQNKTLVITSVLAAPYTMLRETSEQMTGNHRYEGFCVDLIHEISEILGFNYTIKIADDGQHGKFDKKLGRWNGMIGELLDQKADLAIGDLTITYEREQEVDFTMPWMNLGISILYRKPTKKPPNLFSFLSPLSLDVWLYMATAYLGVSLLLFVLARCFTRLGAWRHGKRGPASSRLADDGGSNEGVTFSSRKREAEVSERLSPYEWTASFPCREDGTKTLENQYSLFNSLWFTMGSILQQGTEQQPKAVSTRIVAGMWWFFTLIMISSYTANLAAFLTVERMESPIESAEDLAMQTKIKYGSLYGGSTWNFFSTSKLPIYQRMFSFMESQNPTVYTKSNEEGVKRVQKGDGQYAYMMESSSIEYITERYCDLTQVGGPLDSKSYGIALPPGSPYRTLINAAVLKLQEGGVLHELKRRWWKEKRGGGTCQPDESKSSSKANELGLNNVGGVFVVLLAGMGLASVVAVCEFVWKSRKLATEEHASVWTEMSKELKFALSCDASSKPVRKKLPEHENGPSYLSMNNTFGSTFTTSQYSFSSKDPVS